MASPGELSEIVSRLLGISLPTVAAHDRNLADAGLRTTGGRGRSAARMTPADAAALLIAVTASPTLSDSVETFHTYSELYPQRGELEILDDNEVLKTIDVSSAWNLRYLSVASIVGLGDDHTFMEFLTALISAAVSGELKLARHDDKQIRVQYHDTQGMPRLAISVGMPIPNVQVSIASQFFRERHAYYLDPDGQKQRRPLGPLKLPNTDLRADCTFTDRTIFAISKLLRGGP